VHGPSHARHIGDLHRRAQNLSSGFARPRKHLR
jgi:hypothetical protein